MPPIPNVILFGAPRCGKSSIVNMISGSDAAQGSPGEFESRCYQVPIFGQTFNIWDTPGLEENQSGAISDTAAVIKLYGLLQSLEDGVNLLIFCMRAPRITGIAANNWTLFHDVCDRKVPVVVIVTGLEQQSGEPGGMNSWWFNNKKHFERSGTVPTRHACITTMRGKEIKPGIFTYGQEYNESKEKVSRLIMSAALETAWGVPKTGWPKQVLRTVYDSGSKELEGIITMSDFGEKTVRGCRMSEGEAMVLPSALERHEKGSSNTSAYEKQGVEHVKTNLPEGRTDVVSFAGALPSDVDIEGVGARQKLIGDQLYDSKLMLLFLFIPALHLVTLKLHTLLQFDTTQSPRVYPRQEPSEDPCDPSRYRSFMSLLWTCITTILLFSWRCIHPNIPDPRVEAQRPLTNRWIAGLCGILAPELVWVWAAKESNFALKVQKDVSSKFPEPYPWTLTHSFVLLMGGFRIKVGDEYEVLVYRDSRLTRSGVTEDSKADSDILPKISERELEDLSKSDLFGKLLVLLQVAGFLLQFISRMLKSLPITSLEILTFSFIMNTVVVLPFWIKKPSNINFPLYFDQQGNRIPSPRPPFPGGGGFFNLIKSITLKSIITLPVTVVRYSKAMVRMKEINDEQFRSETSTSRLFNALLYSTCGYILVLPGLAFWGHLVSSKSTEVKTAWGLSYVATPFPTHVLSLLWELATISVLVAAYCILFIVVLRFRSSRLWFRVFLYVMISIFILARLTIIVLSFVSLTKLPSGAFEVLPWVDWIPFVH